MKKILKKNKILIIYIFLCRYPPPPPPREYSGNYFQPPEVDSYYLHNSYEPTQDSQWNQAGWVPPVNVKNIPPPGTTPVVRPLCS